METCGLSGRAAAVIALVLIFVAARLVARVFCDTPDNAEDESKWKGGGR